MTDVEVPVLPGKIHFSIFQFFVFILDTCIFSGGNGNRNGTCFTAIECQDKGGSSSGSCAAGFVLLK